MFADSLFHAYRLAGRLSGPLVGRLLARRVAAGRENPARLGERWGRPAMLRPTGPLIWLHAASVGETVSVIPLIRRLRQTRPQARVMLTTVTTTSAARAADLLPEGAFHQFLPVDVPRAVAGFLDHWRPDAAILVESELWPCLILETEARGVPLALINGRISARSQRNWARVRGVLRRLLRGFSLVLAQTPEDAARLEALAGRPVRCLGNLKFAGPELPADPETLQRLRGALGARPVWLAAATHPGEEAAAFAAHARLALTRPELLTLVAPRHPGRGAEVAAAAEAAGLRASLRSAGAEPGPETQVYVADTLGEMGLWYRLSELAFVGGSLVDRGGQNPLEAARLGCALLFGPYFEKNAAAVAGLAEAGALERVSDAEGLAAALAPLLDDPDLRRRRGTAARAFADAQDHIVDDVLGALEPLLPKG